MSKRKISISIRDPVLYDFVRAKVGTRSISSYICDLIRKDMERPQDELEKRVELIVRRLLQDAGGITLHPGVKSNGTLTSEDKELLKSFF